MSVSSAGYSAYLRNVDLNLSAPGKARTTIFGVDVIVTLSRDVPRFHKRVILSGKSRPSL